MEGRSLHEQQFIRFFEKYRHPVYVYIQSVTADAYAAEELTQELFIKLWNRKDHWEEIELMDQYIRRMAHNACMTWFRKLALDEKLVQNAKTLRQVEVNDVENYLNCKEAQERIREALLILSPQRRTAFELSKQQGLKINEVAEVMGISFHTANHHLRAALSQIKEYMMKHVDDKNLLLLILLMLS